MMTEISLNILDIAENSVQAGASVIDIQITVDTAADRLTVVIKDNGSGMTPEQLKQVTDPFFTSRTTRKVGLGVPFFKYAAESTGGHFDIVSRCREGTEVRAEFVLSHIDRMPMGDISSTIHNLMVYHPETDFVYCYRYNGHSFTLDTRELKGILDGIPFHTPEISDYIKAYLDENKVATDGGDVY